MLRTALACCALIACKGGAPDEDKRAPAPAPIAPTEPADAAPPDAPSAPCFALPLDADGERAGLRFLAHRVPPATTTKPPKLRDVVKLAVGKSTVIPGLVDPKDLSRPIYVPEVSHAEGLLAGSPSAAARKVIAPQHLEGAVLEVYGVRLVTLAIGDAGMATLARYREHYIKPRIAASPVEANYVLRLAPLAILLDDLDGDGALEQISFTRVVLFPLRPSLETRDVELEVGVLWSTGELAFVRLGYDGLRVPAYYVVPPTLSGGAVLLLSMDGQRIALDGKTLTKLPASGLFAKVCVQTSTTEPAQLAGRP